MQNRLGFIGAGNMAEAIARGVLASGLYSARDMLAADISPQRRELFGTQLGIRAQEDVRTVASECPVLLLCVKPQAVEEVLRILRDIVAQEATGHGGFHASQVTQKR